MASMLRGPAALLLTPFATPAQERAAPRAPAAPAPVPLEQVARALKPASWAYSSKMLANGQSQNFGARTITVAPATFRSADAWLVVDAQRSPMATAVDSLFVARADLASLHRAMTLSGAMGEMAVTMAFTTDSVVGEMKGNGQAQRLAMPNVRGAVAGDAVVLMILSTVPLRAGWAGTIDVLNPQTQGIVPLTLTVVGDERVSVPAGTFDAWVIEASAGQVAAIYFVAKRGGVVKVVASLPGAGSAWIETVLEKRAK